jgi:hypothetical protein
MEHTTDVGDDRILDVLGGIERAGCSLGRLGDILVLGSRLSAEPLGPDDCLSKLKALSVALVCALIHWPYCDDSLWTGNLQFQVHIIRHGHKLRVCRPPEDRVVRPRAEVPHVPKRDRQIDLLDGERLHPRYDPVEWRSRRP